MSLGPRTVVDVSICGAGATPKVGYVNESGGVTHLCHVGTFSRACSDNFHSLLISLRARRCMPLMELLERRGGLFLWGERSGSGELPEDNSSSATISLSPGKMGSLPLFCLTRVQDGFSLVHFHHDPLPNKPVDRSLAVDGQHNSAIQQSVWPALLALFPYPDASEETGP